MLKQERNPSHLLLFGSFSCMGMCANGKSVGSHHHQRNYFIFFIFFSLQQITFSQYRRIWAFRNTPVNFGTRFENKVIIIIILLSSLNISLKNFTLPHSIKLDETLLCRLAVYSIKTSTIFPILLIIFLLKLTNYPCKWGIMTKKLVDKWHQWQRESFEFLPTKLAQTSTHITHLVTGRETKKEITYFFTLLCCPTLLFAIHSMLINKCRVLYSLALLSPSTWSSLLLSSSPLSHHLHLMFFSFFTFSCFRVKSIRWCSLLFSSIFILTLTMLIRNVVMHSLLYYTLR